jgi:hypothetical protein
MFLKIFRFVRHVVMPALIKFAKYAQIPREIVGESGGGLVQAKTNAEGMVKGLNIDGSILSPLTIPLAFVFA